jgi:glycosyltransferase involved in cell wall biosynthesis
VLLLIGDGEEEEALRELAAREGVADRTLFVGWRTDVGDLLRAVDLFALPSHNEGMGKALVEAMYLERPVVASRVGGVPELVEDGVEGLLVPPRSPADLADALDRLLRDPQRARELGARAARRAREYSSERMVQRLADLYEELCGTPAAVRREEAAHA